ncbi:MAG: ASCH domain-containing protein [Actinomycetales bacterium]
MDSVIHIAVMVEPYLDKVCTGAKYIESRLTKVNMAPYGHARPGDVVLFKRSGGPIVAAATIDRVLYREAAGLGDLVDITDEFKDGLGYEQGYVEAKALARFVSLMWLGNIRPVASVALAKQSRQAWLTVRPHPEPPSKQWAFSVL